MLHLWCFDPSGGSNELVCHEQCACRMVGRPQCRAEFPHSAQPAICTDVHLLGWVSTACLCSVAPAMLQSCQIQRSHSLQSFQGSHHFLQLPSMTQGSIESWMTSHGMSKFSPIHCTDDTTVAEHRCPWRAPMPELTKAEAARTIPWCSIAHISLGRRQFVLQEKCLLPDMFAPRTNRTAMNPFSSIRKELASQLKAER